MQPTSQKSPPQISPEQTCGQEDSRVKIFRSLAASEGLTEQEVDSFLHLLNSSKAKVLKIDPHGLSLKMLRISYPFMEDGTLRPFSIRWPHSANFGPPQNRERVFIVACRHPGAGRRPKIFPVPAGSGKALIQLIGGIQGKRVYDTTGISCTLTSEGGGFGVKTGLYFIDLCNGNPKLTDHARCIKAKYNSGITNRGGDNSGVLISPAGMDKDAILSFVDICTGKAKLTKEARCILSAYNRTISNWGGSSGVFYGCRAVVTPDREEKRQNGRRIKNCGEPSFTITAQDRHGVLFQDCDECPYGMQIREATKKGYDIARCGDSINLSFPESKTRRGRVGKDLATTLETSCNQGTAFAGCGLIRRLTPRECWRLQGFTDEMFDKARAVNSDNQLYRQAGNSVTVPVIYAIGKQILAAQKALKCGE